MSTSWRFGIALLAGALVVVTTWRALARAQPRKDVMKSQTESQMRPGLELVTFGGGCFWCVEAIFAELDGVVAVESGYSGGQVRNPSYEEVTGGDTGHAEVIQILFDPKIVSLHDLLTIFFTYHDPTTKDRQGADRGPQYRSIVLWRTDEQLATSKGVMKAITEKKLWPDPIVTENVRFDAFWPAEAYHQQYYSNNPKQGYCRVVIEPKVVKFRKEFASRLKKRSG